jgi:hypothetical protein
MVNGNIKQKKREIKRGGILIKTTTLSITK